MFCENIYHICQSRCNYLNTNKSICYTLPRNRNIIPPQPEHHFSTTGATFSRHKH